MANAPYTLTIVVPVYNEAENVPAFLERTLSVLRGLDCGYEIIFSMDPCTDDTERVILEARRGNDRIKLLKFTRRFGQPAATLAGLHYASGDACVVIDCDLQDPPELIPQMVARWREGYDVAYAQRRSRKGENPVRRLVAYSAYFVINRISDVSIPRNTGDFRLLSRRVVNDLKRLKEGHGFLRGLVGFVGYRQVAIPYDRDERRQGTTKYNLFLGSLKIGFNGIVGFSHFPLHVMPILGLFLTLAGTVLGAFALASRLFSFQAPRPFLGLAAIVFFVIGLQCLALGLMGEYVGRIYDEVRQRPLFLVESSYGFDDTELRP